MKRNVMMNYLEEYDETDPISIETYAKRLIGKTFADVCVSRMISPKLLLSGRLQIMK